MSDITVSSDIHTFMQSATNSAARDNLGVGDSDAVNHASLTLTGNAEAVEFIGDLEGAVRFNAKAGEALNKGDAVYVSGVSGTLPVVSKADSSDTATMPSFGLAASTVVLNAAVQIVTFGTLSEIDTSSFTLGDTLYVNGTGTLQTTKPTGESNLVQNIGKVQRVHASAGSIKVGGAGRTNDTPNLNENKIFIGNASNQATTQTLSTAISGAWLAYYFNRLDGSFVESWKSWRHICRHDRWKCIHSQRFRIVCRLGSRVMIYEQRANSDGGRVSPGLYNEVDKCPNEYSGKSTRLNDQSPESGRRFSGSGCKTRRRWRCLDSSNHCYLHSVFGHIRTICNGVFRHSGNGRKSQDRHTFVSRHWIKRLEKLRRLCTASRGSARHVGNFGILFRIISG